jgi:hypothetical protein
MKKFLSVGIMILFISISVIPLTSTALVAKSNFFTYPNNHNIRYNQCSGFNYENNKEKSTSKQTEDVNFFGQSNESLYIVKVSNPNDIILESLSVDYDVRTIGKKFTSGGYQNGCSVYDENMGGGLEPLMFGFDYEFELGVKLRYFHFKLGNWINYTFENRTLIELDNETIDARYLDYPWSPTIPPGTWHFVFSSVVYDLEQKDVSTEWKVWMNFSGNCSGLNISTGEGGKVHTLWYGKFDTNFVISRSNMLEMMIRGKADFHIENTFFYTYTSFPMMRGFWNVKWITPEGVKRFQMLIIRGRLYYDEDDVEGCFWGMGGSGNYKLITSYIDYGRTIWGGGIACYPIFVGLDLKLP